jgi:serine/threonine protein kinase/Flp pilus assembly protein TadD
MNSQGECISGDDSLIDQAIAEFLRAEAAGEAGDRQKWLDRFPECAESLAEFFDDREGVNQLMMPVRINLPAHILDSQSTEIYPAVQVLPTDWHTPHGVGGRAEPLSTEERKYATRPSPQLSPPGGGVHSPPAGAAKSPRSGGVKSVPEPPQITNGRYRPLRFHARGGMGEIWVAIDERIGRKVAVKKLRSGRETEHARFLVEAQITGQLEHPSIVPLHDIGLDDAGQPFYIMKYIHGRRLREAVAKFHEERRSTDWPNDVEFRRLLETFVRICNVVAYAHHKGVLHRDIKPDNVMLGPYGETLVVDWGLAKVIGQPEEVMTSGVRLTGSGSTATQDGAVVGSPAYVSPEGAEGRPEAVDHTSDVYLLGATLYEILTARPPRQGSTSWELIDLALHSQPTAPRKIDPQIPRALEAICLKAMAYRKEDRYQSPLALVEDVERYLAGAPTSAFKEPLSMRIGRWVRRNRRGLLQAAAALLGLTLAGIAMDRYQYASLLAERERAREQLVEFHRLADEAQYFAANADAISERVPYYDPRRATAAGNAALAIAENWGPQAERLPLPQERRTLKQTHAALLFLMAKTELEQDRDTSSARQALAMLDTAQKIMPPSRSFLLLRSQCRARLEDKQAAQRDQEQALKPQTPITAQDYFVEGELLRVKDSGSSALRLAEDEGKPDREYLLQAIDSYRNALQLDPQHYWARFQLGRCLLALGRGPEAVEALSACAALRPDSPWAITARGLANWISGRTDDAIEDLNRAVELDPNFQPARLNRGVVRWQMGDHDNAIADFDAVLTAPPDRRLVEAAYYRAQILLEKQEMPSSLSDLATVIDARPDFRPAYWFRAKAQFRLGNDEAGQSDLETFLKLDEPTSSTSNIAERHFALGRALRKLAQEESDAEVRSRALTRAATELETAIASGLATADVYQHLGAVRDLLDTPEDAIAAYSKGIALSAENVPLRNSRGWAYVGGKQYKLARADFAEALLLAPDNSEAHCGLGYTLAQLGQNEEARREASAALLTGADNQLALHNIACIYGRLSAAEPNRKTEHENLALAALDRAVSISRQNPIGLDADERTLIGKETSFPEALKSRPEFKQLIDRDSSKTVN